MSEEWTFRYKCRQCGKHENGSSGEKGFVYLLFVALTIDGDVESLMEGKIGTAPLLKTTHQCHKNQIGIADLIGIYKSN
ncbi:hypothetical protein LCGC14_1048140 [marine sediment metagenome]|uniref:Uncharacterized protein n=1 Tax=marine sediment metagenome TaxID=412755 RepID=A0A0F9QVV6_9ZZZZ